MSEEKVVQRRLKNNRRKTTDGYRTDSGCFEDVDLRHSPTLVCSEYVTDKHSSTCDSNNPNQHEVSKQYLNSTPTSIPTLAEDSAEDKDFHDILKRLSEITGSTGDLYRLCFNSRLSFGGHAASGSEETREPEESIEKTFIVQPKNENCELKKSNHDERCAEFMSLLSSLMSKVRENPNILSHPSLGNSCENQLSSLISSINEAKQIEAKKEKQKLESSSLQVSTTINDRNTPSPVSSLSSANAEWSNHVTAQKSFNENKSCINETESDDESVFYILHGNTETDNISKDQIDVAHSLKTDTYFDSSTIIKKGEENVRSSTFVDESNDISSEGSHALSSSLDEHVEDNKQMNTRKFENLLPEGDGMVANGRRTVKPYSWDYGDIWENEVQAGKRWDSFSEELGYYKQRDLYHDMSPSFEEIRDDLFHNAGFICRDCCRIENTKRRSRSADARCLPMQCKLCPSPLQGDSPFARTIYHNDRNSGVKLRRSWSSQHISGDSMMVSVDWTRGRKMRVFTDASKKTFDDITAQSIKNSVARSSTFRGTRPWSVLKRRPSGLRRRSTRNQSYRSSSCSDELFTRQNLESSALSRTTSSDCLTTTSDESSSINSSPCALSSPSVSNRNSGCFSDISSSDSSDIRRVVFQGLPSECSPRDLFNKGYVNYNTTKLTLNERFGLLQKNCALQKSLIRNSKDDCNYYNLRRSNLHRHMSNDQLNCGKNKDQNYLTKVKFLGDSYSRSNISKNIRHSRNRSRSPSPVSSSVPRTRVLSCEIVKSDHHKRDVYTKVSMTGSLTDEDSFKVNDTKLGRVKTRRSWHGHSSLRSSSSSSIKSFSTLQRHKSPTTNTGDAPLLATLVTVDNPLKTITCSKRSTIDLGKPSVKRDRISWEASRFHKRESQPSSMVDLTNHVYSRSKQRQPPPDYFTAVKCSHGFQQSNKTKYIEPVFSTLRQSVKKTQPSSEIIEQKTQSGKLKSVGPSSLKENLIMTNSPLTPGSRRWSSLNENNTLAKQRLQSSDVYRRRTIEMNQKNFDVTKLGSFNHLDQSLPVGRRRYNSESSSISDLFGKGLVEENVSINKIDMNREKLNENRNDEQNKAFEVAELSVDKTNRFKDILSNFDMNIMKFSQHELNRKEETSAIHDEVNLRQANVEEKKSNSNNTSFLVDKSNNNDVLNSPVLPHHKTQNQSNDVKVFIDYRCKQPVSVEYTDEDVSFLKTLGNTARSSRKDRKSIGRSNVSCSVLDADEVINNVENMTKEIHGLRLSCKTQPEQELLKNLNTGKKVTDKRQLDPSPQPYRKDSTIICTDARSDTDSISRDSTVSSSGSDMTVILHEDTNISAEDLKHMTESGAKIGIELDAVYVEATDEETNKRQSFLDELPPAMELSNTFSNYPLKNTEIPPSSQESTSKDDDEPSSLLTAERNAKNFSSPFPDKGASSGSYLETKNLNNTLPSCISLASSHASNKSNDHTECSNEKNLSRNVEGKGFFARLKSFRKSFRRTRSMVGSKESLRTTSPALDANANVLSGLDIKPSLKGIKAQDLSRTSRFNKGLRHLDNCHQRVVGLKSVSSDHLNHYRISTVSQTDAISAKSLEILIETCI